jgi:hypothetical protein
MLERAKLILPTWQAADVVNDEEAHSYRAI